MTEGRKEGERARKEEEGETAEAETGKSQGQNDENEAYKDILKISEAGHKYRHKCIMQNDLLSNAGTSETAEGDAVTVLVLSLMEQLRAAQELAQLREGLISALQDKLNEKSSTVTSLDVDAFGLDGDEGGEGDDEPRLNLIEALRITSDERTAFVITVRKIHKLGYRSAHFLRSHFQQFGPVEDVVLLPMRARPKPGPDGHVRASRPSSMGFVVFASKGAAQAALLHGPTHNVRAWPIEVRAFVRPKDRPDL